MLQPYLQRVMEVFPVVVITGARQTGKTTLVRDWVPGAPRRFFSLDAVDVLAQAKSDPDSLLGELPVTIDEVQRAPELLLAVKRAVDRKRVAGGILLTGSADFSVLRGISESLAGRAVYLELCPFCPDERKEGTRLPALLDGLFAPDFSPHQWSGPRQSWHGPLLRGGYPSAMDIASDDMRGLWFGGYVQTYLERDLRQISNVANLGDFQTLMRLAANRACRVLNESGLARDAAMAQPTCHRHLQLMETGCLIARLESYHTNPASSLRKARKLVWKDCGLAAWLAGIRNEDDATSRPDAGFWLEQTIHQSLQTWRSLDPISRRIFYWRGAGTREVDFLLDDARLGMVALEIKTSASVLPADGDGLRAFAAAVPDAARLKRLVVLHGGEDARPLGGNVLALPWSRLMEG